MRPARFIRCYLLLPVLVSSACASADTVPQEPDVLVWRSAGPTYEKWSPDRKLVASWHTAWTYVGDITVKRHQGAIVPLGEWVGVSEAIGSRNFGGYEAPFVKLVTYRFKGRNVSAYEANFPDCPSDNFSLFSDDDHPDADKARDYVFKNLRLPSSCPQSAPG